MSGEASVISARRVCAWCRGAIPEKARRDAETCSKRCRQARHRFARAVGVAGATPVVGGHPRRIAYADPPYPGKSALYYGDHQDYAGEVDHAALIAWLSAEHDAWALSTSAEALPVVLALCPAGVRVAAWHRGFRPNRAALAPLNAWEPVIYGGQVLIRRVDPDDVSRPRGATCRPGLEDASCTTAATGRVSIDDASRAPGGSVEQDLRDASSHAGATRRVDSLVYRAAPRTTDPTRVIGAKPAEFCRWLFELLAATSADELVDVFPGSGGVSRAWESYAGKPAIRGDRPW